MQKSFLALLCLVLLSACSVFPEKAKAPALLHSDHVLANKIWDVRAQKFISQQQLLEQAVESEFLLLGETHDNPLHHRYQAWMIDGLGSRKRSAVVAFEMISRQQETLLASGQYDSVASLLNILKQAPTNWQYEPHYTPLFKSAINANFNIRSASLNRENIRAIGNKGVQEIPAPIKTTLDYNTLTAKQEASLRKEIVGSHCGMDHEGMVSAMMLTQRVKDAVMMDSLLGDSSADAEVQTKILVAGSGHTRKDWGVPKYLVQSRPDGKIMAMAWLEVVPEAQAVTDYAKRWGGGVLPFDYVWFTARIDRPDPCEQFRRHMEKRQSSEQSEATNI